MCAYEYIITGVKLMNIVGIPPEGNSNRVPNDIHDWLKD